MSTETNPAAVAEIRAGRQEWIGLAVLAIPALLVSIDAFVLMLALPHLSVNLQADSTEQLWIVDIYSFLLSGFLLITGSLGDRIGRRKVLLIGASIFGVASGIASFSTSPTMLITCRALLGIGGAALAPSSLALISNMFRDAKQRSLAIGIWFACFMTGSIIGPFIGGVLLSHFWWGSVFLLGVPFMVLLLVTGPQLLPEYRVPNAERLDIISAVLWLGAILPIVYGIKEIARNGVHTATFISVPTGVMIGIIFFHRQQKLSFPLIDLRLFANLNFTASAGAMLFGPMLLGTIMFYVLQYLQLIKGLSPLQAGFCMLPAVCAQTISFLLAPVIAGKINPQYIIACGMAISTSGLLLLTTITLETGLPIIMVVYGLVVLGSGPLITLTTDLMIGSAPLDKAGAAAAVGQMTSEFGFALGIAAFGSLGTAIYRTKIAGSMPTHVPKEVAKESLNSLAGAIAATGRVPEIMNESLRNTAQQAFVSGIHSVSIILTLLTLMTAAVSLSLKPQHRDRR